MFVPYQQGTIIKDVKKYLLALVCIANFSCSTTGHIDETLRQTNLPETWQVANYNEHLNSADDWLIQFDQGHLTKLVQHGLDNNYQLKQQAYRVQILQQQLVQAKTNIWPNLSAGLSSNRSKSSTNGDLTSRNTLRLDSSYEIDLWGKLSAEQKSAHLSWLASKADYQQSKQNLVASITRTWLNLITAKLLQNLFEQRVETAQQSLDIIESGYRQGLNRALDVYLSRNELNSEKSNLASQQANILRIARDLEQLIGRYPSGTLVAQVEALALPDLPASVPTALPSDILGNKPDLLGAWQQVLALDANLAFRHKQRFPSIRLTASASNSSQELSDLLSSSSLGWSLLGNLTAPIFNAGQLKSAEQIARLRLRQQEQIYLSRLHGAFADVENALTNEQSLRIQYQATRAAQDNALAAQSLAFEQYQRGLVNYTTVLNAQQRAFNAQSSLIRLTNQLLSNRIDLHLALGGDFSSTVQNQQDNAHNE